MKINYLCKISYSSANEGLTIERGSILEDVI